MPGLQSGPLPFGHPAKARSLTGEERMNTSRAEALGDSSDHCAQDYVPHGANRMRQTGIEPVNSSLARRRSTAERLPRSYIQSHLPKHARRAIPGGDPPPASLGDGCSARLSYVHTESCAGWT